MTETMIRRAMERGVAPESVSQSNRNLSARAGNLVFKSGQTSDVRTVLGSNLSVEDGYAAARDCPERILRPVRHVGDTPGGLNVVKLVGAVYSGQDFTITNPSLTALPIYSQTSTVGTRPRTTREVRSVGGLLRRAPQLGSRRSSRSWADRDDTAVEMRERHKR